MYIRKVIRNLQAHSVMKKGLVLLLISSHLFSVVGFSMLIHTCNDIVSYKIFGVDLNTECECIEEEESVDSKCCKTDSLNIKADVHDKTNGRPVVVHNLITCCVLPHWSGGSFNAKTGLAAIQGFRTDPPPEASPTLYLLHRSIRI